MSNGKLTPTSYVVLGLVAMLSRATPYDMKRVAGMSIGNFWAFPHSQLYAEPARLAGMGLLAEEQEEGGRRRRVYTITETGRQELMDWLTDPQTAPPEIRDPALLKLFFSDLASHQDVARLAERQVAEARDALAGYEELRESFAGVTGLEFSLSTLQMGIVIARASVEFWTEVLRSAQASGPGG